MKTEYKRMQWLVGLICVILSILIVLALSSCSDRSSPHSLQALAEQAELERLGISDLVEVSTDEQAALMGGRLYVYQTTHKARLLWVSADNEKAHILDSGIDFWGFLLTDLDGDGNDELAFIEENNAGKMLFASVVVHRVGERIDTRAFSTYVSYALESVHLRALESPPRLEVMCGDNPLGWIQFDHSLSDFVYKESDLALHECRW